VFRGFRRSSKVHYLFSNRLLGIWTPAWLGIWLAGCATTPPSTFYTLEPLPAARLGSGTEVRQSPAIGIGPVSLPTFLDRPQLVTRSGSSRLAVDELHRWGGSLLDDFPRVLGENLAYLLGTSRILLPAAEVRYPVDFRVAVDVLRFEATVQGEAVLKVRWALLDPYTEEALLVQGHSYRSQAASTEPAALVEAMSRALGDFSREVAAALQARPRPRRPANEPAVYHENAP
jgi:hypothetical protein